LAHHFDTPQQQFDSGKLGMWIFLVTEVLFFGGVFCAYAVYRSNHPEIFVYAHQFLDVNLGALNTCVLIFSSLTMALGVRYAQLGQKRRLITCLAITLACAFVFMGVKYVEYRHKWHEGLLWAKEYDPEKRAEHTVERGEDDSLDGLPGTQVPSESADQDVETHEIEPKNVGIFFSIYFAMTGLHGLHVLAGMIAITWLILRARHGVFGPLYFGPVDYVGLYWHLVDLIWIYLFPLLYLIG
jgi:cytochrome c oxidase subunit 3